MKTTVNFPSGAVKSCAIHEPTQWLTSGCGRLGAIESKRLFSQPPAPVFRAVNRHHFPKGNIYFATDGETIKIGYSGAPRLRVIELRNRTKKPLRLIAHFPGCMDEENNLHRLFADLRAGSSREWFRNDQRIYDFIAKLETFREPLCAGRLFLNDIITGKRPMTEAEQKAIMAKIPTNPMVFERWANNECGKWPPDLQLKAYYAIEQFKKLAHAKPDAIEVFTEAYRKWAMPFEASLS